MLIQNAPNNLELDQFKEFAGELYCFRQVCDGCQYQESCDFNEEKVNIGETQNLRRSFLAHDNYVFFSADYSGIELRICALITQEPKWVNEFNKPPTCPEHGDRSEQYHLNVKCSLCEKEYAEGLRSKENINKLKKSDLHTTTAKLVYPDKFDKADKDTQKALRQIAKQTNFGLIYGGSKWTLAESTGLPIDEAELIRLGFFRNLPYIKRWHKEEEIKAAKDMWVSTFLGRKRSVAEVFSDNYTTKTEGLRTWWNHIVQGTAADIMKIALIRVFALIEANKWEDICRPMITVHDELDFEVRADMIDIVVPAIADTMRLDNIGVNWSVPLEIEVEYGKSWDVSDLYSGPGSCKYKVEQLSFNNKDLIEDKINALSDENKQVPKIFEYKVDFDINNIMLKQINDTVTNSSGDYQLILSLTDGYKILLNDRFIDPVKFESNIKLINCY